MSWDRHTESSGRIDPAGGSSLLRHGGVDGGNVLGGIERRGWEGASCLVLARLVRSRARPHCFWRTCVYASVSLVCPMYASVRRPAALAWTYHQCEEELKAPGWVVEGGHVSCV